MEHRKFKAGIDDDDDAWDCGIDDLCHCGSRTARSNHRLLLSVECVETTRAKLVSG